MSNTTFVHEVDNVPTTVRVSLTLDVDEAFGLAAVAKAAVDAGTLLPEHEDVTDAAVGLYQWALKAAGKLKAASEVIDGTE